MAVDYKYMVTWQAPRIFAGSTQYLPNLILKNGTKLHTSAIVCNYTFKTTLIVCIHRCFLHIIRNIFANLILAVGRCRPAKLEKEVEQEVTYNKGDAQWRHSHACCVVHMRSQWHKLRKAWTKAHFNATESIFSDVQVIRIVRVIFFYYCEWYTYLIYFCLIKIL